MVRVRFAPSPTGYLHVGGARTALFNWLYARKQGGRFLLRIEDTDKARSTDESTRAIYEGLTWLGLTWDEEVVHQGANVERHRRDAHALLASGAAYRCFCTAAELDARRAEAEGRKESFRYDRRCDTLAPAEVQRRVAAGLPHTIRFRVPEGQTSWVDMVHGAISFPNKDIDDLVILRSDGTPIYNLAVVSDDIAMRITHVLRGEDHISNTPKQILLYRALGAELPVFAHFPNVLGTDGKKLSKRHGATAVGDYQHMGILPEAMCNFLALLGWSPGGDREVMTREEMIGLFSEDGLLPKASVFDLKKLEWMNGQYMGTMDVGILAERIAPDVARTMHVDRHALDDPTRNYSKAVEVMRPRARTLVELAAAVAPYVARGDELPVTPDSKGQAVLAKDPGLAKSIIEAVLAIPESSGDPTFDDALGTLAADQGIEKKIVFQTIRVAATGTTVSPPLHDVKAMLGATEFKRRLIRLGDIFKPTSAPEP